MPEEVETVIVAPGISAPLGSAMCPCRLAVDSGGAVGAAVTFADAGDAVGDCARIETLGSHNARAIEKRVKQRRLECTYSSLIFTDDLGIY